MKILLSIMATIIVMTLFTNYQKKIATKSAYQAGYNVGIMKGAK